MMTGPDSKTCRIWRTDRIRRGFAREAFAAAAAAVVAVAFALLMGPVFAVGHAAASEVAASSDPGLSVDTYVASNNAVPGLAVMVSVGGEVRVQRYYGYSDLQSSVAVDETTCFEWGRCSDLVIIACLMQLVESSSLSLSDSIASYLPDGVRLPQGYSGLKVSDLLDHTTGLDVAMMGQRSQLRDGTRNAAAALALFDIDAYLEPGEAVAYTPYDMLLAALVVEGVSGLDICDYVEQNIFGRLGMDSTVFMVGGSASRYASSGAAFPDGGSVAVARGFQGLQGTSTASSALASVFVCFGTVSDMTKLANALMGLGDATLFESTQTSKTLFETTRTYPGLGIPRIAHGLFAFPLASGVYGISASTGSGFSASVFLDAARGAVFIVAVNQAARPDMTQGIPALFISRTDLAVGQGSSNAMWIGTYQDASLPDHGPMKIVTALARTRIGVNAQGTLTIDSSTATPLGQGVYSADTAMDQDVYRFHVSLASGSEFSRVASDSYVVAPATLYIEYALIVGGLIGVGVCIVYIVGVLISWIRARVRRRRWTCQNTVVIEAVATAVMGGSAIFAEMELVGGMAAGLLKAWQALEWVCLLTCALCVVWLCVTRWRGRGFSRRQNAAFATVALANILVVMNVVYWEMLL